ncbi:MAG: hypothetical protein RMM08_05440 [Armatimonadota bacterium]|nr:hypothetical protein [bacterium]MDW8320785.1 hypothetical protein [Armatimonadota bacterium]
MANQGKRTMMGIIAAVIIVIALVVIGLQWSRQQKEKQEVLPTERPSWFGGGAGAPGGTPSPAPSGR